MSVNKVILIGRLGQDPELRHTPTGQAVSNFSVATNEAWTDKSGQRQERTEWHRIVVWGKQAELCNQYLAKGRQVYVEGRLQTRQWQDQAGQTRYTTEVQAQGVRFLGAGATGDRSHTDERSPNDFAPAPQSQSGAPMGNPMGNNSEAPSFTEDDIPF